MFYLYPSYSCQGGPNDGTNGIEQMEQLVLEVRGQGKGREEKGRRKGTGSLIVPKRFVSISQ